MTTCGPPSRCSPTGSIAEERAWQNAASPRSDCLERATDRSQRTYWTRDHAILVLEPSFGRWSHCRSSGTRDGRRARALALPEVALGPRSHRRGAASPSTVPGPSSDDETAARASIRSVESIAAEGSNADAVEVVAPPGAGAFRRHRPDRAHHEHPCSALEGARLSELRQRPRREASSRRRRPRSAGRRWLGWEVQ